MIDSHAHIYAENFSEDLQETLSRAKDAGVRSILMPNIDLESITPMHQLADDHSGFLMPMMGLHPCSVQDGYTRVLAEMREWFKKRDYVAVGEIGIDLYWDTSTRDIQIEAFRIQCEWAIELDLPVVIHSRESIDLIIDILEREFKGRLKGVFHCFTGDLEQAKRIEALGMYLGLGGVLTFKNSHLRGLVSELPLDRILIETDSPYLAPAPYRGKRNEPAYVKLVLEQLSNELSLSVTELDEIITNNTLSLFKI